MDNNCLIEVDGRRPDAVSYIYNLIIDDYSKGNISINKMIDKIEIKGLTIPQIVHLWSRLMIKVYQNPALIILNDNDKYFTTINISQERIK